MRWVFRLAIVLAVGYEAYALWTPTAGDTISEIVWHLSEQSPLLPFALGFLMGHFVWPRKVKA